MNSTSQNPKTDSALKQGVDWVAKHWPRIRLGHEGFMLNKIDRQARIVETIAKNAMTGDTQNTEGWPDESEEDEMGVKIGDTIYNFNEAPPAPPSPPAPTEAAPPQRSRWGPVAVAASMGFASAMLGNAILNSTQPSEPIPASVDTDTDTVPAVIIRPHGE